MSRRKLQVLVFLTSLLVVAGVFLPLASIPVYGDITYNRIASVESYLVILMGIFVMVLLILGKTRTLILPVIGIWIILLYPAIKAQLQKRQDAGMFDKMISMATDPLQDFAENLILNITEFNWGGYMFLASLLILSISSSMLFVKSK